MVQVVQCPECSSRCLTLKERSLLESAALLLTGRQHYQCGGCGRDFDSHDRRAGVRRNAILFLLFVTLAGAATLYYNAEVLHGVPGLVQREWHADIDSVKDDGRLTAAEGGTVRSDMRRLWEDMKYEARRLKSGFEQSPGPADAPPQ
jgi:DNA-directed RNA polymerase subunit RPC12/RpoP